MPKSNGQRPVNKTDGPKQRGKRQMGKSRRADSKRLSQVGKAQYEAVRKAQKILWVIGETDTGTGDYLETEAREALAGLNAAFGKESFQSQPTYETTQKSQKV